ncbi:MAG TPA: hypothetical protein VN698_01795 [Bacteroidia bacterium]|nr:hypothetical protein [Bacteroidia bacterium]
MEDLELRYKQFQEKTSCLNVIDSIYTVWALMNNFQFDIPLPNDIQIIKESSIIERRLNSANEWELEFILKEILKNGLLGSSQYNLKENRFLSGLTQNCRFLEDNLYAALNINENEEIIFKYTFNQFHRQFVWQEQMNLNSILYRYYKIFSYLDLDKIIENKIGMKTFDIIRVGFYLTFCFFKRFFWELPLKSGITSITNEALNKFIGIFATQYDDLRKQLIQMNDFDHEMFYKYTPLRGNPLIILNDKLYCPIVTSFVWQYTSGLYYRMYNEEGFSNAFGKSFQDYIGFIINKAIGKEFKLIPEAKYIQNGDTKDSIDWIIEDVNSYLFIECKTKRLLFTAKTELKDDVSLKKELDKMASFIIQSYKTISDCRKSLYTNLEYNKNKKAFLLILTLEDWFISNSLYYFKLRENVIDKIKELGIDESIVNDIPFFINSTSFFEKEIQLISHIGISLYYTKTLSGEISEEKKQFTFKYLHNEDFLKEFKF